MTGESKLKRAIQRIRDVAGKATEGPWRCSHYHDESHVEQARDDGHLVAELGHCDEHPNKRAEDAEHLALWDPTVAELVAALLEAIDRMEQPSRVDVIQTRVVARELADAINGELTPSIDEQVELASKAIGEAAEGSVFDIPAELAGEWPGTGPKSVSVTYLRRELDALDHASVDEVRRQLRAVRLYGCGFLLDHGGQKVSLDPTKVTLVLPDGVDETVWEMRARIVELERWRKAVLRLCDENSVEAVDGGLTDADKIWPSEIRAVPFGAERPNV